MCYSPLPSSFPPLLHIIYPPPSSILHPSFLFPLPTFVSYFILRIVRLLEEKLRAITPRARQVNTLNSVTVTVTVSVFLYYTLLCYAMLCTVLYFTVLYFTVRFAVHQGYLLIALDLYMISYSSVSHSLTHSLNHSLSHTPEFQQRHTFTHTLSLTLPP